MGPSLPNSGGPLRLCHTSAQTSSLSIFKRYSQICHTSFLCKRVVSDGTSNLLMSFSWDMRFWDFSCCICMPTTRTYMDHYGSICFHWVSHCQACRSHSSGAHAACLGPSLMRRSVSLAERLLMNMNLLILLLHFDNFAFAFVVLSCLVSVPLGWSQFCLSQIVNNTGIVDAVISEADLRGSCEASMVRHRNNSRIML